MNLYRLFVVLTLLAGPSLSYSVNKQILRAKTFKGHRPLSYKAARKILFGVIYLQKNSFIQDIYCQIEFREKDGVGPLMIPDHSKINTEHAWPKKRFSKKVPYATQKSDLFHLFPTANQANSYRGELYFGEAEQVRDFIPGCPLSNRGNGVFTPPDEVKGDLARALFYFSIRYNIPIIDIEEGHLRNWHLLDPVDEFERVKNNLVEKYQGNRNPFIDHPENVSQLKDF